MNIASTLHKSLQSSWSTSILTRHLNNKHIINQLLEDIYNNFNKYENKIKIRILLSFLTIDQNIVSENALQIKKILEIGSNISVYDPWVTVIAGLVNKHLFPLSNDLTIEESSKSRIESIVNTTLSSIDDLVSSNSNYNSISNDLLPYEAKYMSKEIIDKEYNSKDVNTTKHFTYTGAMPNFLEYEKSRLKQMQSNESIRKSSAMLGRVRTDNRIPSFGTFNESKPMSRSGLLGSIAGSGYKESQRHSVQTIGIEQAKQLRISANEIKRIDKNISQPIKKKLKLDDNKQIQSNEPSTIPPTIVTTVPINNTIDQANIDKTNNPASSFLDLSSLLTEYPNLSEEDKDIIIKYNAIDWYSHFPPDTPMKKITLTTNQKIVNNDIILETIYLTLNFSDHRWQKSRKTKRIGQINNETNT